MSNKICFNRHMWLGIVIIELLFILGGGLVLSRRSSVELNYTQDDLLYNSGENGFYLATSYGDEYISTPEFTLPKGFYTLDVEVEYRDEGSISVEIVYPDGLINKNVSDLLTTSESFHISTDFRVRYSDRMMIVKGRLNENAADGNYILIRNIRITSSPVTVRHTLFWLFVLIIITNILLFYIQIIRKYVKLCEETALYIKILLVLTAVISLPLMVNYLYGGVHDLLFHLLRIEGIKEGILNGEFPVRVQHYWLNDHGYPVSVFYGDLLLYIPALLRIFGFSIPETYHFYVLLINIGTVFISYFSFSKIGGDKKTGLICAIVFSLNIYRLTDIYTRGAVGEYTALMFMPLVLYGLWSTYMRSETFVEHKKSWIPLTVGCVGIFLSHMISTAMVALIGIIAVVVMYKKTFRKDTFFVLLKSAVYILLLSLWFLVPFFDYLISDTYVMTASDVYAPYQMEDKGLFLAQLFLNRYSVTSNSHSTEYGILSEMPMTTGLASMLVLAGWFVLCFGKKGSKAEKREEYLAVFLSVLCLLMTLCKFPWTWFSSHVFFLNQFETYIQFPMRFIAVASTLLAWLLCVILKNNFIDVKIKKVFATVLVLIAFWQGISYMSDILNVTSPMRVLEKEGLDSTNVAKGEYLLEDKGEQTDKYVRIAGYINQLTYAEDAVSVSDWYRENGRVAVSLTNNTEQPQQIEVPLLNYKGYHAITENGDEIPISSGTYYRIAISLPAHYSGMIWVEFREPWYWRLCELISLGTLLALIGYPFVKKRRRAMKENVEILA